MHWQLFDELVIKQSLEMEIDMKKRILALILVANFAIAGCGSSNKPNAELDKFADEIVVGPDGDIWEPTEEPTATAMPTAEPTVAENDDKSASNDVASSESNNEASEEEAEKYYLTFEASTIDGEAWNSDKFANSKLTMINVWGTYCNPCLSEMPDLGEIASEYDSADFRLIGVICDVMEGDDEKNVAYAKELIDETKADYPHLLLNESLYVSFMSAVSAVPTTFFVRQDGSLIGYLTGAQSKENWKALIDQLLAETE